MERREKERGIKCELDGKGIISRLPVNLHRDRVGGK
jgi:hypothetical protein